MNLPVVGQEHQEIAALTVRYAWDLDSHEYQDLRNVFLPDATAKLGSECDGIEAIIKRISSALDPLDASQHLVANQQVVINPDGVTGSCRCYFQAQHIRRAAAVDGLGPNYIVAGRYLDRVERTSDGWRIRRRDLEVDWTDGNLKVIRP